MRTMRGSSLDVVSVVHSVSGLLMPPVNDLLTGVLNDIADVERMIMLIGLPMRASLDRLVLTIDACLVKSWWVLLIFMELPYAVNMGPFSRWLS